MPRESQPRAGAESSGQGLKIAVIILGVVCLGLAFAFYKSRSGAREQAETAAKFQQSLSHQVAELRTKLALDHSTSALAQSNLQSALDRRIGQLLAHSNLLAQTSLLLSNAQHESRTALADLQVKASSVAELEAQHDESSRRLEIIPALKKELADTKERLNQTLLERGMIEAALGRERVEKAGLERQLEDPAMLRLQIKKLEDQAALRKRLASDRPIKASDPRLRLELRPDGTVRPAAPGGGQD